MEQQAQENPFVEQKKKAPTFLLVLCILTFIGSGIGVFSSGFGLLFGDAMSGMAEMQQEMVQEAMEEGMTEDMEDMPEGFQNMMESTMEMSVNAMKYYTEMQLMNLLVCLISIFGALMMLRLKKAGYFMYVIANVIGIIVPLVFLGVNLFSGLATMFGSIFTIAFIVMYSLNLKHME